MAVTLLYEPQESPIAPDGIREAAVFETLPEALLQAAWDEMVAPNRYPDRIIAGAHHGSSGWDRKAMRRGRPRHHPVATPAHDADAKVLADWDVIEKAVAIVRRHWVVHPDDAADRDPAVPPFGSPRVAPPNHGTPSPSAQACLDELAELVA